METKKFQGLKIANVKKRLASYRLQMTDNSVLDIPRIELGGFIPQKGMTVRYQFYLGIVLQKVEFDGKVVINRITSDLMRQLDLLNDILEKDSRHELMKEKDPLVDRLPETMRTRTFLLLEIGKKLCQQENLDDAISYKVARSSLEDVISYEVARSSLAAALGSLGLEYIKKFRKLDLERQQAVLMCKAEEKFIADIILLAEAYAKDLENNIINLKSQNIEDSEVLKVGSCFLNIDSEILQKATEDYLK